MRQQQRNRWIALAMSILFAWMIVPSTALAKPKKGKTGALVVSSTSYGAEIRIDGEMIARVPFDQAIELSTGVYELRCTCRTCATESVTIQAGKTVELEVDLIAVGRCPDRHRRSHRRGH